MRVAAIVMGAMVLGAATPKALPADERLAAPPAPGFVVAYTAANEAQSIREEVPKGETFDVWTRMITTQRFAGVAQRLTPADYLDIVAKALPQSCPGGKTTPIAGLTVSGHTASRMRADCPILAATGKPETFFILAIAGARDMHVKQIAFRRVPTAADEAYAASFLGGVKLCGPGSREAGC